MIDKICYRVFKDKNLIHEGISPINLISLLMSSIIEPNDADKVEILFNDGEILNLYSPKLLINMIPDEVPLIDHNRWIYGITDNEDS
jgi:hypothetical protein